MGCVLCANIKVLIYLSGLNLYVKVVDVLKIRMLGRKEKGWPHLDRRSTTNAVDDISFIHNKEKFNGRSFHCYREKNVTIISWCFKYFRSKLLHTYCLRKVQEFRCPWVSSICLLAFCPLLISSEPMTCGHWCVNGRYTLCSRKQWPDQRVTPIMPIDLHEWGGDNCYITLCTTYMIHLATLSDVNSGWQTKSHLVRCLRYTWYYLHRQTHVK